MAQWRRRLTVNQVQRNIVGSSPTPSTYADMAELEDAAGSNPAGEIRAGSNPAVSTSWRFGREAYCASLENWRSGNWSEGSNPSVSVFAHVRQW